MTTLSNGNSNRPQAKEEDIERALKSLHDTLNYRMEEKGRAIFLSRHEIEGVLDEEAQEVKEAVRGKGLIELRAELLDVAVAAIWGVVSIDTKELDW